MSGSTLPEFSTSIPSRSSTPNNASSLALTQSASNSNHSYSIDKAFPSNARKASYGQPPIRNLLLDIPPPDPVVEQVIRGEVPRLKSKSKKRRKKSSPIPVNDLLNPDNIQEMKNQLQASKAALKAAQYNMSELESSYQQLVQQRDEKIAEVSKSITEISSHDDNEIVDSGLEKSQDEKQNEFLKKQQVLREKIKALTKEFEGKHDSYRKKEEELEQTRKRRLEKEKEQTHLRKRELESIDRELANLDSGNVEQLDKDVNVGDDQEKEEGEEIEDPVQLKDDMVKRGPLLESQRKTVELEANKQELEKLHTAKGNMIWLLKQVIMAQAKQKKTRSISS